MTKTNDGGPAFPSTRIVSIHGEIAGDGVVGGMTLRDYFAVHATVEDFARFLPTTVGEAEDFHEAHGFAPTTQWARYQHADAMLAARTKEPAPATVVDKAEKNE